MLLRFVFPSLYTYLVLIHHVHSYYSVQHGNFNSSFGKRNFEIIYYIKKDKNSLLINIGKNLRGCKAGRERRGEEDITPRP